MMIAWGVVPTGPQEISIYWTENYRHPSIRLRRGVLRADGFVSLQASVPGGELVTRPLVFDGNQLVINYSTSAAGGIRVEIQDAEGKPIPGFTLAESNLIYGDDIERVVLWKSGPAVGALSGKTVRLRLLIEDADLYSLRFRP